MIRFALRRIAISIPILFGLSIIVFWATRRIASPEGQLTLNPRVTPEAREAFIRDLGLDKSNVEQYFIWLGDFVRGDLGTTLATNREVWPQIESAFANTAWLIMWALTFSLLVGITVGAISAARQNSAFDVGGTMLAFLGFSIPVFWLGLMLQLFFGVWLPDWIGFSGSILPTSGLYSPGAQGFDLVDKLRHTALPAIALSVQLIAVYSRYMRASMLEVLHSDYLRTARSKGLSERRVITRHGIRTALIPVTTQAAVDFGALFGGLVVTEQVFQYPGMGLLFLDALTTGDYQVMLPWLMITASLVILINLAADMLYAWLDPRIRYV